MYQLFLGFLLLLVSLPVLAGARVALVVGNSNYQVGRWPILSMWVFVSPECHDGRHKELPQLNKYY